MKFDDVTTIYDEGPGAGVYWSGWSNYASTPDGLTHLWPLLVLAKGKFVEFHGECGRCVMPVGDAVRELKGKKATRPFYGKIPKAWLDESVSNRVVCLLPSSWNYNGGRRYHGQPNQRWEPGLVMPGQLKLGDVEYQSRCRLRDLDKKRHERARKEIEKKRIEARQRLVVAAGFAPGTEVVIHREGWKNNGKLLDASFTVNLPAKDLEKAGLMELVNELLAIKDPVC